ncbi:MAG: hypothetical protein D6814_14955, partial [Calditrichaeota bacterium]
TIKKISGWLNRSIIHIILYYSLILFIAFYFILNKGLFKKIELALILGIALGVFHLKVLMARDMTVYKRFFWGIAILIALSALIVILNFIESLVVS